MPIINLNSVIERKANLLSCQIDNETVLLDMEVGVYLGMNKVASRIWELIAAPVTVAELLGVLIKEYEIDEGQCREEMVVFLNNMLEKNIIGVKNIV